MISRVLEPEAMDSMADALDYDAMDHAEVNRRFVADLLAFGPPDGPVLDLGTGTALVPIELARQCPEVRIVAVDVSENMLHVAAQNLRRAGLADRITLERIDAKRLPYPDASFATVMSNSIIHHVPNPLDVLGEAWRVAAPGGLVFFRDLARPDDEQTLQQLVEMYTAGANAHQRQLFADSLRAAVTAEELAALVARLGVDPKTVTMTSDRHWTWAVKKT
jgi:ubiquinone/menaquinone biosynthesis C-methylase UbiE